MGIGVSIFLIAVGAILAFAVEADTEGINLETVGWILLIVGVIGAILSLTVWGSLTGRRDRVVERDTVRERDDV